MTNMITNIRNGISAGWNKVTGKAEKHAPEILIFVGVFGAISATVMACRASTKLNGIIEESKSNMERAHQTLNGDIPATEDYTEEDAKKELAVLYVHTGVKIARLYTPSVILGVASLTAMLASNDILRKRGAAVAAAYAGLDSSFKEYRKRVADRFGDVIEKEIRYNAKAHEVEETITDESGNEQKVTHMVYDMEGPCAVSPYARFFEEFTRDEKGNVIKNLNWDRCPDYNLLFLKTQEKYANDLLKSRGRLFLNEVYQMLGLPISKIGQLYGWVYDEKNPVGDNYVDFGLYSTGSQNYSDFVYGTEDAILLDFNVDGNIWELM